MIQFKPSNLDKPPYIMQCKPKITLKNAAIGLGAALLVYAVWTDAAERVNKVKEPVVKAKEQPRDVNGLTADMRHNIAVCAKVGMLYLSELTVLGFKAECLTRYEYDRRLKIIDRYVANSQLKELK